MPVPFRLLCKDVPQNLRARVLYVLDEIGARIGTSIVPVFDGEADGVYGPEPVAGVRWLKCDPAMFETVAPPGWFARALASVGAGVPEDLDASVDRIGAAFRLITLADERGLDDGARTKHGNMPLAAHPADRRAAAGVALFDRIAVAIAERFGLPVSATFWPGGAGIAVCVTHDTDAVNWGHPLEMAFNSVKRLLRGSRAHGELVASGLRGGRRADATRYFELGRRFLDPVGAPSTHYLSVIANKRRTLNDVRSRVDNNPTDWARLKALAADGHEFGYHAPIPARDSLDEMVAGKRFLEERLERSLFGVRHHYWSIDWKSPWLTQRKHVNAGFRYDASMAFPDAAGSEPPRATCFDRSIQAGNVRWTCMSCPRR